MNQKGFAPLAIIVGSLAFVGIGLGSWYTYTNSIKKEVPEETTVAQQSQKVTEKTEVNNTSSETLEALNKDSAFSGFLNQNGEEEKDAIMKEKLSLGTFAANLKLCEPLTTTFVHPLTGDTLERSIVGITNDKCKTNEQMPNNGMMECNYTEEQRFEAANYYYQIVAASNFSASINSNDNEATSAVDGTPNLLQDYLTNGTCVITGY